MHDSDVTETRLLNNSASTLCRPIDFLGIDNDRLAIMCVFGAAAGSILLLIFDRAEGRNAWETGMNAFLIFVHLVI